MAASTSNPPERAFDWWDPRRAGGRIVVSTIVGVVAFALIPRSVALPTRAVTGWDAAGATMLSLAWLIIARSDADETKRRASSDDPGRTLAWLIVLVASTFSLFAGAFVQRQARALSPDSPGMLVGLCLAAVLVSWLLLHTAFTLRYAHLFYRDDREGVGGLVFPGDLQPDAFDFAYFAFTIGMCFQVSDVCITSRQVRRAALGHACLAFAYNTVILALALNLAFGLIG